VVNNIFNFLKTAYLSALPFIRILTVKSFFCLYYCVIAFMERVFA